ncbi:LamG-like jellyroll fold domain-containing protein [Fibrobacter succinogenes]|uniref:LamG-like jellyroll fold domain-containing protein n=1 Tax=Fibrobacter succinogenes TaxID=833 RepID=UPI00156698A2|nr:LamG-like jellyroll fold domain-containing protein [Fibrobacter succinogenes]
MKNSFVFVMAFAIGCWSTPRPMESVENYNVLLLHGAYGEETGWKNRTQEERIAEAYYATEPLDSGAALGRYYEKPDDDHRLLRWLTTTVFEEPEMDSVNAHPKYSYVYQWRSFSNPANSSHNNAFELGDRTWSKPNTIYKHRRALMEEAQEVKAKFLNPLKPSENKYGQAALEIIRKDPDRYRQLASRYILIGHSMGGIVSREYVQGDFYNGDVDKIITLDSPHRGTGALNMQLAKDVTEDFWGGVKNNIMSSIPNILTTSSFLPLILSMDVVSVVTGIIKIVGHLAIDEIGDIVATLAAPEKYYKNDSLVHYVDPNQRGYQTIDSLNRLSYVADSLPMFRILASQHGMTFTDPNNIDYGFVQNFHTLVDDNYKFIILNVERQLNGTADFSARYVNVATSAVMGLAGIPVLTTGSNIVPAASSEGWKVHVLNDENVDIKRAYFNAAPNASETLDVFATTLDVLTNGIIAVDQTLDFLFPEAAKVLKIAMALEGAVPLLNHFETVLSAGVKDLTISHTIPLYKESLDTLLAERNSFSPRVSDTSSYTPYLMEDFLYERPFVNLALNDIRTLGTLSSLSPDSIEKSTLNRNCYYIGSKSGKTCAIGLFSRKDTLNSFQQEQNLSALTPLLFKSESDWSKMGVKVDRWEMVDGLKPNGDLAEKSVPIRHVERYVVPDNIVVQNYIEKYSFVVDDLMPHRLREIYMNFNFQRELVWECNIEIDPTENNACKVYKRRVGEAWPTEPLMTVPHPVLKNGRFDFNARDYFGDDHSAIQKGNQNTVTISLINKIGLSNTQRFSYLYKSARNLFEPSWPLRDIVVNKIDGFSGTASSLDYHGFSIVSAKDSIFRCLDADCRSTGSVASRRAMAMSSTTESKHFASGQAVNKPAEGSFFWVFNATSDNNGSLDSSDMNLVPFVVDTTAPKFSLRTDSYCVNPDSSVFLVRVKVNDDSSAGTGMRGSADIRAMHWTLERKNGGVFNKVADLPYLYDVASNDFAVDWAGVDKKSLRDGLYRVKATAIDYALPNMAAYVAVNNLSEKIVGKTASEADWDNVILHHKLNVGRDSVEFRVDRVAPTLPRIELRALPAEPGKNSKYASLPKLARSGNQYAYVSKDSLLNISYTVREELNGRSGTPVLVSWNFRHVPDSNAVVRAMDSLWMGGDTASGTWAEEAGLLLEDGEYRIFAVARDEAKNISSPIEVSKKLRVDRTAPRVENVVSTLPVYDKSSNKAFEVSVTVSESGDVTANRTGMRCSYRVLGGQAENTWRAISSSALHSGTRTFNVDKNLIGNNDGKRYLEVACIDMAGNVGVSTSLFYVGKRYPNIVFPTESDYLQMPVIPIVGIAPPDFGDAENTAVYRLRYREENSNVWRTRRIETVHSNRSKDNANISKIAQSNEGVLGYFYRDSIYDKRYVIELGVKPCDNCPWRTDSVRVTLGRIVADSLRPTVAFNMSKASMVVGTESVDMSLRLTGNASGTYMLRVYAEDTNGVGIFDKSVERAWANPYYGAPYDLTAGLVYDTTKPPAGVWFYQDDSQYHLRWSGLPDSSELRVFFLGSAFGKTCSALQGGVSVNLDKGCRVEAQNHNSFEMASEYLNDYPMMVPPPFTDSVMILSGDSGHVVMDAKGAFRVAGNHIDPLAGHNIPVYFGSSEKAGLPIMGQTVGADDVNVLQMGWSVHPNEFGLSFTWDGYMDSKSLPAEGTVKVYAEVTSVDGENAFADVQTKNLRVSTGSLQVVLDTLLPAFPLIDKIGSTEIRHSVKIPYGILNKDARVTIEIRDSSDAHVATLLKDELVKAHSGVRAHSVIWNGMDDKNKISVDPGKYTVVITALPDGVSDTTQRVEARASLPVVPGGTMVDVTPGDRSHTDSVSIYVSEAVIDSSSGRKINRYEPIADFFVEAELKGKYLPENVRNAELVTEFGGKQHPLRFTPERFSLGIKRQRESLKLVAVYWIDRWIQSCTDVWEKPTGTKNESLVNAQDFNFNAHHLQDTISIDYDAAGTFGYLGMLDLEDIDKQTGFHMFVITWKDWVQWKQNNNGLKLDTAVFLKMKEDLRENILWDFSKAGVDEVVIPPPGLGGYIPLFPKNLESCGPGGNPFIVELVGNSNNNFYDNNEKIKPEECDNERYRKLKFDIVLSIPPVYWNADVDCDNLVNRTLHFDSENSALYGTSDGYFHMLANKKAGVSRAKNLFDGSHWQLYPAYGHLTPFETQHLPFFSADELYDESNPFLFADEFAGYTQRSRFTLKFYNDPSDTLYQSRHFVAHMFAPQAGYPRSITNDGSVLETDFMDAGEIDFYVGMNKTYGAVAAECGDSAKTVNYPAKGAKPKNQENGKYYLLGSRIHHYYNDYSDSAWLNLFTLRGDTASYFKNLSNSSPSSENLYKISNSPFDPDSLNLLHLDSAKFATGGSYVRRLSTDVFLDPDSYDASSKQFSVDVSLPVPLSGGIEATDTTYLKVAGSPTVQTYFIKDKLYIDAANWTQSVRYRRSLDPLFQLPERSKTKELKLNRLYRYQDGMTSTALSDLSLYFGEATSEEWTRNRWIKDVEIVSPKLMHLDDSEHSHLYAVGNAGNSSSLNIQYKNEISEKQPLELVELRANLGPGKYRLLYLNDSVYYPIGDELIEIQTAGDYRLAWFNVNMLQGNTQFLLTWGGDSTGQGGYCSRYNLVIGKHVKNTNLGTVSSLFGELSVTFPAGSLDTSDDFTVRTIDAGKYDFSVYNDLPITGPIMEVLPSKEFKNPDALPRVQIKISKSEMQDMKVTPSTLKLYKVDIKNKRFVPLDNVLYGYLDADGNAAVANGFDMAKCETWNNPDCYPGADSLWEYILISGVTRTFSIFAAIDSRLVENFDFKLEILPAVATTPERDIRVNGLTKFDLYVDNDSLWKDSGDVTPVKPLPYTLDADGIAHVQLPRRGTVIDTNYVFVVARNDSAELPLAPDVARALTVPTEFACSVPSDSVWLGLDNGYMAYGATCNQPGNGTLSLYLNNKLVTEIHSEIPDTIIYDGSRKIGTSVVGKIGNGVYESRYLGMSVLGNEMQMAGPKVYTDSARPEISLWNVSDSTDVLNRIFVVSAKVEDSESGVAKVEIRPMLGTTPLKAVLAQPDSNGMVSANIRVSRKQLANCVGCNFAITMRTEDYGHNYVETSYVSRPLYPYPQSLALWYPAREGFGWISREILGTHHDLNLAMYKPWLNDVGLYFYRDRDRAVGNGNVYIGTSNSYAFEARVNFGYPQDSEWRRVMGFSGADLDMEIQVRNRDLRLVEQGRGWVAENVLPQEKAWSHVVVSVDADNVNFYVDGNLVATKVSGITANREFNGIFSIGESSTMENFVGHIADVRFYLSALSDEQVMELSKPVSDEGEEAQLIIVNVNDMNVVSGFDRQFTCSVVGNNFYRSSREGATLNMSVDVAHAGKYNLVLYARSAKLNGAEVEFGGSSKQKGTIPLASVWKAYMVPNVALDIGSGLQNFELSVPAGVDIAGLALATEDVPAQDIAWNVTDDDGITPMQSAKVKTFVRYEDFANMAMLRPRIRIENISGEVINGFSVRYYFRGEAPSMCRTSAFFPQDGSALSVHSESNNTGYVEWKFPDVVIQENGSPFAGAGPHFGLNTIGWDNWYSDDDPSFVPNAAHSFVEDKGIIVLDNDNNLIGGSCAEMEDEIEDSGNNGWILTYGINFGTPAKKTWVKD